MTEKNRSKKIEVKQKNEQKHHALKRTLKTTGVLLM